MLAQVVADGFLHLRLGECAMVFSRGLERDVSLAAALDGEADPEALFRAIERREVLHRERTLLVCHRRLVPGALGDRHDARVGALARARHGVANFRMGVFMAR